ncbi:hypothetical protein FOA52_010261 [Chlamydomonas sp. UWO 241]|nr:hypothetical protein FOA52_010261 [Chlamydomonas sp. UWO 241]
MSDPKYIIDEYGQRRLKGTEFVLPLCIGSVAWWQGKKAQDCTHRWSVYVRGPNNEDLSYIIKRVTFELHEDFVPQVRSIENQPFEVSEGGWGEFEIGVTLHFTADARESEAKLYHRLRLHEDDGSQSQKKPVVNENYEEVIFSEPHEDFYQRVSRHVNQPTSQPLVSQLQWLPPLNEADELARIQAARMKVASLVAASRGAGAADMQM